jgi:transcriptional repressor NrdR
MFCVKCFHPKTTVTNSRPSKKNASVWRRRHCPNCGTTWTTRETVSLEEYVTVADGPRKQVPYSRGTLLASIITSLIPTGATPKNAYWLVETIEIKLLEQCRKSKNSTLDTTVIAETAYETLLAYYQIAGLAYGAAHQIITGKNIRKH